MLVYKSILLLKPLRPIKTNNIRLQNISPVLVNENCQTPLKKEK